MKYYIEETYGGIYEADNATEAQEMFENHNECQRKRVVPMYGPESGFSFQNMSDDVDQMPESEKKFYLWCLLRWYQTELEKEMNSGDSNTKEQYAYKLLMKNLFTSANEMEDLLCDDLF